MIKFFDKFIAQSSKGQMAALAALFLILALAGAGVGHCVLKEDDPNSAKFGYRSTWGLMQCVDGGFVDATISSNTKITSTPKGEKITENAPIGIVVLSLGFWLLGMILISFFTGAATNFLDARREKILIGSADYSFRKKYILIVGFDFQTGNLIKYLLKKTASKPSIVLVTDSDVGQIYGDLLPELELSEARRLFIMRKDITVDRSYETFHITGAEEIYVIGDGDAVGRDGRTLQAFDAVARKAERELEAAPQPPVDKRIKAYLHIEDYVYYANVVKAIGLSMDKLKIFDLDVFNYYESWAWECWSDKDATDGRDPYLPLRHIKGSKHTELFVLGASPMGLAMVNFAMLLMNYGADGKQNKITLIDLDESKRGLLPDQNKLDALPEVEVVFRRLCFDEANAVMLEAAGKKDTSVTVVIAVPDPAAAIRAYAGFSERLCLENISVLIWQATESRCLPQKSYLRMGGQADNRNVRFFGMTDWQPWKNPARLNYGMAVNYYYACWFPWGKEAPESAAATAPDFVEKARAMWDPARPGESEFNGTVAGTEWSNTARWKKWSSINCGDTFREKAVLLEGVPYAEAAEKILKAEHNRWWTEKILGGWLPSEQKAAGGSSHADKKTMTHGDMIPFEELPDEVRDKDKINIAAMAAYGFLK